ncbi:MAG: AAA family ATPase [Candidatus Heimdallarchaeota archaeon]|nr:AAA family ATPase [Candidatus Heimdallarchaeota archaeon]
MPIIAVSGPHGSGKSTAAKRIAEELNYEYISAGELFRSMADNANMNLAEFSKKAELQDEIDKFIDDKTVEIAESKNNIVIDAQLGGWMLKDIADMLVYITAPFDTRIDRITLRELKSTEQTRHETDTREESEKSRYQKLYNIDISDLTIYDIILNSQRFSATDCVQIILLAFEKKMKSEEK